MRDYELTYIVKPDLDPAAFAGLIERVNGFITTEGGIIVKTNQWGLRHLAYPIRRYREGQYVFQIVQLESPSVARIEQRLRLLEDILRYLLVRADEDTTANDVMGGAETDETTTAETLTPDADTTESNEIEPVI
jgi:small subunit ribosomal protein S6